MKLFFDFFPILVFFIAYKLLGIYVATAATMGACFLQISWHRYQTGKYDKNHLLTLAIVTLMGGATLLLHDPIYIKWKPTILYWAMAAYLAWNTAFGKKLFVQSMMGEQVTLPLAAWRTLSHGFTGFFILMGVINIYVLYHFSTDQWVNYKLFGSLILTVIFVLLLAWYISKTTDEEPK